MDVYAEILGRAITARVGTPDENFKRGKQLLDKALDCLDQERDAATL